MCAVREEREGAELAGVQRGVRGDVREAAAVSHRPTDTNRQAENTERESRQTRRLG